MIKVQPFGFPRIFGFADGRHSKGRYPIEYYYSQGMQKGLWGLMNGYNIFKLKDTGDIPTLGNVKWFGDASGKLYAYDDAGNILKEATPGAGDFAIARAVGAGYAGQGLIGDQKGRLLYFGATVIGMLAADGTTYTDSWQTGLTSYDHPADTYEDMVLFGNKTSVGLLSSTDSLNITAFTVPSSMTIDCLKAGKTGVLIGANLGFRGVLMLWDAQSDRSIAKWIWTNGKVQSIERTDSGWIVVTQKEILLTNGYSTRKLFPILDDPLGFAQYTVAAQGISVINNKALILNQANGYGRLKSGLYVFDLSTTLFEYVPVSSQNVSTAQPLAIYTSKSVIQEVVIGYRDTFLAKNYIGSFVVTGGASSQYIPEILADSSDEKVAEAIVLSVGVSPAVTAVQTLTFNVAVKLFNFARPLWGVQSTNSVSGATNQIRVNGTVNTAAQVGDEITILEGLNAGQVAHISSIANQGALNETWTLDTAFPNLTELNVHVSVQPWVLVQKKTFSNLTGLQELYFNASASGSYRGKRFLAKILVENAGGVQLEFHRSEFVYDDLGTTT